MDPLNFLVAILVVAIIGAIVWLVLGMIPMPPAWRQIFGLIVLLVLILWLFGYGGISSIRIRG